jgi:hypothetical protein
MYHLNNRNSSQWLIIAFAEYFLYMIIFSLYFQINEEILIFIAILSSLLLYRDYSILKKSHNYFESISKKIFIIVRPVYLKNFLERVVILICIIVLVLLWKTDVRLINVMLQCLFLFVAFGFKHVYRLRPRDSVLEEVKQLTKDKGIGKMQLYNNEYTLYTTRKDLRQINGLLDQKMDF